MKSASCILALYIIKCVLGEAEGPRELLLFKLVEVRDEDGGVGFKVGEGRSRDC